MRFIEDFIRADIPKQSVIALQEVHGNPAKVDRFMYFLKKRFHIFYSFTPSPHDPNDYKEDQGSVITMIPLMNGTNDGHFNVHAPVPGRTLRVSYTNGNYWWTHWNIHNHDLSQAEVRQVTNMILDDAEFTRSNPEKHFIFIAGDFNFLAPGEFPRSLSDPDKSTHARHELPGMRPYQTIWQGALDKLIEIKQPNETH